MAIFSAIAGAIAAIGAWVGTLSTVSLALLQIGVGLALNVVSQLLFSPPKQKRPGVSGAIQLGAEVERSFGVGAYATKGSLVYHNTWGGNENDFYTRVTALSDLPINALTRIRVDGKWCLIDWNSPHEDGRGYPIVGVEKEKKRWLMGAVDNLFEPVDPNDFPILGPFNDLFKIKQNDNIVQLGWVKFYDGTQITADQFIIDKVSSDERPYGADRIGTGVAYAITTFKADPKVFQGFPDLTFELRGINLDDPRGGTGHSNNPIVQAYNLTRGIYFNGEWFYGPQKTIPADIAEISAEADKCDALPPNSDGMSQADIDRVFGGTIPPRYVAGMEITVGTDGTDVLEDIMAACNGRVVDTGTRLRLQVGDVAAGAASITDDDFVITAQQVYDPFKSLAESFNAVSAIYPSPDEGWEPQDSPPILNPDFEAADDNRRLTKSIDLVSVYFPEQVQRLLNSALSESRRMRTHVGVLPSKFDHLEVGDFLDWTSERNAYVTKRFRIDSRAPMGNGTVRVALTETDPADYETWIPSDDYQEVQKPPVGYQIPGPLVVGGFNVAGVPEYDISANAKRPAILFVWSDPDHPDVTGLEWQIRLTGSELLMPQSGTSADVDMQARFLFGLLPNESYDVRMRFTSSSRDSEWTLWHTVVAPNLKPTLIDLDDQVQNEIDQAQSDATQAQTDADSVRADHDALTDGFVGTIKDSFDSVDQSIVNVQADADQAISDAATVQINLDSEVADLTSDIDAALISAKDYADVGDNNIQTQVDLIQLSISNTSFVRKIDADDNSVGQWTELTGATAPIAGTSIPPGQTGKSIRAYPGGMLETPYYSGSTLKTNIFRFRGWLRVETGATATLGIAGSTPGNGPGGETVLGETDPIVGDGSWHTIDLQIEVTEDTEEWAPAVFVTGGSAWVWRLRLEDYTAAANLEASIQANATAILDEESARLIAEQNIRADYEDADSATNARIDNTEAAIVSEAEARALDIQTLSASVANGRINLKNNWIDGDAGNWTPSVIPISDTAFPYVLNITNGNIHYENPQRPGDMSGKTVRVTGEARTNQNGNTADLSAFIYVEIADLGRGALGLTTIVPAGQDWTKFDEILELESFPQYDFIEFRPGLTMSGDTSAIDIQIKNIEYFDITEAAVANATAESATIAIADEESARIQMGDTLRTDFETADTAANARIDNTNTALSDAESSLAQADQQIRTDFESADAAANARIDDTETAISDETSARTSAIQQLETDYQAGDVGVQSWASNQFYTQSAVDNAISSASLELAAELSTNTLNKTVDFEDGDPGHWNQGTVVDVTGSGDPWTKALQITNNSHHEWINGYIKDRVLRVRGYAIVSDSPSPANLEVAIGREFVGPARAMAIPAGTIGWQEFDVELSVGSSPPHKNWRPLLYVSGDTSDVNIKVAWVEFRDVTEGSEALQATTTLEATLTNDYYAKTDADQATAAALDTFEATYFTGGGQVRASALSNYFTKAGVNSAISAESTTINSRIDGVEGDIGTVSANLSNNYLTEVQTGQAIAAAETSMQAYVDAPANWGFESGAPDLLGTPAGWYLVGGNGNVGYRDNARPGSDGSVSYGSAATNAGPWWYISKFFEAKEGQEVHVNFWAWLGDVNYNGEGSAFVGEDDAYVHFVYYDKDGNKVLDSITQTVGFHSGSSGWAEGSHVADRITPACG